MRYIRSFWFSTNYDLSVTILPAWAEDRATVGTDPSADPGAKTEGAAQRAALSFFPPSGLASKR